MLHALQDPKVNIAGIRRGDLLADLDMFTPSRLSRQLRRLRDLGVIKRIKGTYAMLYPDEGWTRRDRGGGTA